MAEWADQIAKKYYADKNPVALDLFKQKHELDSALDYGVQYNPDSVAKDQAVAKQTELPLGTVEAEPEQAGQLARKLELQQKLEPTQFAKKFFSDPNNAAIAHDDADELINLEDMVRRPRSGLTAKPEPVEEGENSQIAATAAAGATQATLGISESIFRTPGAAGRWLDAFNQMVGIKAANDWLVNQGFDFLTFETGNKGAWEYVLGETTNADEIANRIGDAQNILTKEFEPFQRIAKKGQEADMAINRALEGDFEGVVDVFADPEAWAGFIGQAAPSLYAAYKSGGSIPFIAWLESMEVASDVADFEERTGQKVPATQFLQAQAQVAIINSYLERTGLEKIFKGAGGGTLSGFIRGGLWEGGTEVLQNFNTNVAALTTYDETRNPLQGTLQSFMGGFGSGGPAGAFSAIGMASGPDSGFAGDIVRAQTAMDAAEELDAAVEAANAAKLKNRDGGRFRSYLNEMLGAENAVYMDAGDAQAFFQSNPEVLGTFPEDTRESVSEALRNGSDVAIPKADYLAYMTDFHSEVRDILRNDMDGMNVVEANRWAETGQEEFEVAAERLLSEMDQESEFRQSLDRVTGSIEQGLLNAGQAPENVKRMVALPRAFYTVTADKMGLTPEQLIEQFPQLRMQVAGQPMADVAGLTQAEQTEYQRAVAKGLPMDQESRMVRAKEQGWDDTRIFYRGSTQQEAVSGQWLTEDPEYASLYAERAEELAGDEGNVMPLLVRGELLDTRTKKGKALYQQFIDSLDPTGVRPKLHGASGLPLYSNYQLYNWIRDENIPVAGVFVDEGFTPLTEEGKRRIAVKVFDPTNIRSINAAFDPDFTDSANLLAQGPVESFEGAISEQGVPAAASDIPILPIGRVEREMIAALREAKDGNLTGRILSKIFGSPKPRKGKEGVDSNVRPTPWKTLKKWLQEAIDSGAAGNWYQEFGNGFREIVGEANLQEASILFGITSQQNAAETNFADTLHIMSLARKYDPITDEAGFRKALREEARADGQRLKVTGSQIDNIVNTYHSGTYKGGLKVSSYMQMIKSRALNEFNPYSVQDVHMARVFGYRYRDVDPKTKNIVDAAKMPSAAAIRYSQFLTSRLAQEFNMRPDQVQAYLWFYAKQNLSPKKQVKVDRKVGDGTYDSAATYSAPEIKVIQDMVNSGAFDTENALTPALETGAPPHFESPVKRDPWSNLALNEDLLKVATERAGRVVVSMNPGNARGYGFPAGTDLQTLLDYQNAVLDAITDEDGQIRLLRQMGIVHEIRPILGTWDRIEPSLEIIMPGESMQTANMSANILGHAFLQDAAITTEPKWEGQNFAIAVRKPDGSAFTPQDVEGLYALVNPEQDPGGLNLSTSADGTAVKFLDPVFFEKFDDYSDADLDSFFGKVVEKLGETDYTYTPFTQDGDYHDFTEEGGRDRQQIWDDNGLAGRPDLQRGAIDNLYEPVWQTYQRFQQRLGFAPQNQESPHQDLADTFYQGPGIAPLVAPDVEARIVDKLGLEQLSADEFRIIDNARFDAAIQEYNQLEESAGGKILNVDTARELSSDYLADRTLSASVHEPASFFIKELYRRKLAEKPAEGEYAQVLFTAGGTGAGKSSALRVVPEASTLQTESQMVYDTNMNKLDSARKKVQQALDAGKEVIITLVARDPVDALVKGALPRAERQRKDFGSGRTVPITEHANTHTGATDVVKTLAEEFSGNENLTVIAIDNTRGRGNAIGVPLEKVPVFDYNTIVNDLSEALEREYAENRISQETYQGFKGVPQVPVQAVSQGDDRQPQPGSQQALAQLNRGQIQFTEQGALITLLENADLSTFLHESGHFFFEAYKTLARENDAIRADMGALLDFVGVDSLEAWESMSLEERRAGHERVAQAFERYLFEGKAPSLELQSLFDTFVAWLKQVYRNLLNLNVPLTDEVRGVFDRMLATDQQIQAKQVANAYAPIFESAEDAGMTALQWQEYQAQNEGQQRRSESELTARSLKDMQWLSKARSRLLREMQRDHDAKRRDMREQVAEEVKMEPAYYTANFLRTGEAQDQDGNPVQLDSHKIDREEFRDNYPEISLNQVRGMTEKDGVPMDLVAEQMGWTSGDEMIQAILRAEPINDRIDRITDQRMLATYGDLSNPEQMEAAVEEALHNEAHLRFLHTELKHLIKKTGVGNVLNRAAKLFAKQAIDRKKVKDVKPYQYSQLEARAGRLSQRAHLQGDRDAAAQHKRAQVINAHFFRAANNAKKDIEKALRYFKRITQGRVKNIDPDYLDQMHAQLEKYDFRQASVKELERRKSFAAWVEQQEEMGFSPNVDDRLLSDAKRQHYKNTPVEELMALYDSVKNIEHLGRLKNRLIREAEKQRMQDIEDELIPSIEENARGKNRVSLENNSWWQAKKEGIDDFFAMHRKFASFAREMDGNDYGPMWNYFIRPMNERGDWEADQRSQATEALGALFDPILKGESLRKKMFIPEIDNSLSREGRITVALNWGNEQNRQRIVDGYNWNEEQVQAILDTLTEQEWNFVQGVWDFIDSYWDQISAKERRVTGVAPQKVERAEVRTPFGTYEGGYYPIMYDPRKTGVAAGQEVADILKQQQMGAVSRATTRRGHTKARQEKVDRPVRLDLGGVFRHVDQVVHDLAWHEWLIDANRLIRRPAIDKAIREGYGPEIVKSMRKAIEDIAMGEVPAMNAFERAINHLRSGVTIAGMGWSLWTSLLQPIGLTQSMVRIGPKWVGKGLAQWLGDAARMESTAKQIYQKSTFMRMRGRTMMREINEIQNKVSAGKSVEGWQASFFYMIQKLQLVADIPTWLGEYNKQIENNQDERTAVAMADQAVLDSQSGGQIKDLAQIQRGSPLMKLFTNFYSYFNMTWNLTAESFAKNVRHAKNPLDIGRFMVDFLLLYSLPATLSALMREALRGECGFDDEECVLTNVAQENLGYMAGTLVGVREASGFLGGFYGYEGPAGARFFSELSKFGQQVAQGEVDKALIKSANQTAGILFHYPAAQAQRTAEGLYAVMEGDVKGPEAVTAPLFGPPR